MTDWYANNFKSKCHIEITQGPTLPYMLELHRIEGLKLKVFQINNARDNFSKSVFFM